MVRQFIEMRRREEVDVMPTSTARPTDTDTVTVIVPIVTTIAFLFGIAITLIVVTVIVRRKARLKQRQPERSKRLYMLHHSHEYDNEGYDAYIETDDSIQTSHDGSRELHNGEHPLSRMQDSAHSLSSSINHPQQQILGDQECVIENETKNRQYDTVVYHCDSADRKQEQHGYFDQNSQHSQVERYHSEDEAMEMDVAHRQPLTSNQKVEYMNREHKYENGCEYCNDEQHFLVQDEEGITRTCGECDVSKNQDQFWEQVTIPVHDCRNLYVNYNESLENEEQLHGDENVNENEKQLSDDEFDQYENSNTLGEKCENELGYEDSHADYVNTEDEDYSTEVEYDHVYPLPQNSSVNTVQCDSDDASIDNENDDAERDTDYSTFEYEIGEDKCVMYYETENDQCKFYLSKHKPDIEYGDTYVVYENAKFQNNLIHKNGSHGSEEYIFQPDLNPHNMTLCDNDKQYITNRLHDRKPKQYKCKTEQAEPEAHKAEEVETKARNEIYNVDMHQMNDSTNVNASVDNCDFESQVSQKHAIVSPDPCSSGSSEDENHSAELGPSHALNQMGTRLSKSNEKVKLQLQRQRSSSIPLITTRVLPPLRKSSVVANLSANSEKVEDSEQGENVSELSSNSIMVLKRNQSLAQNMHEDSLVAHVTEHTIIHGDCDSDDEYTDVASSETSDTSGDGGQHQMLGLENGLKQYSPAAVSKFQPPFLTQEGRSQRTAQEAKFLNVKVDEIEYHGREEQMPHVFKRLHTHRQPSLGLKIKLSNIRNKHKQVQDNVRDTDCTESGDGTREFHSESSESPSPIMEESRRQAKRGTSGNSIDRSVVDMHTSYFTDNSVYASSPHKEYEDKHVERKTDVDDDVIAKHGQQVSARHHVSVFHNQNLDNSVYPEIVVDL